jgi:hypothetical protein
LRMANEQLKRSYEHMNHQSLEGKILFVCAFLHAIAGENLNLLPHFNFLSQHQTQFSSNFCLLKNSLFHSLLGLLNCPKLNRNLSIRQIYKLIRLNSRVVVACRVVAADLKVAQDFHDCRFHLQSS